MSRQSTAADLRAGTDAVLGGVVRLSASGTAPGVPENTGSGSSIVDAVEVEVEVEEEV